MKNLRQFAQHQGLLFRLVAAVLEALRRRGTPAALARLSPAETAGYAMAIAYMLGAQFWTLSRGAPRWKRLQAEWTRAEADAMLCERLAGRLSAADVPRLIASGEEGFALRDRLYQQAARSIDIATYYVQPDETGGATMRALAACVSRGCTCAFARGPVHDLQKGD